MIRDGLSTVLAGNARLCLDLYKVAPLGVIEHPGYLTRAPILHAIVGGVPDCLEWAAGFLVAHALLSIWCFQQLVRSNPKRLR